MNQTAAPLPPLALGEFVLNEADARLTRDGTPVDIPPKAFAVLCHLVRNAQRLVTKDELLDAVWGHRHVSESVLKSTINQLRTQLGDDPRAPRYIETANRRGYRFIANVAPVTKSGSLPHASPPVARDSVGDQPPTILLVDDEPEMLSMLDEYLGSRGFRVMTAGNTQEARSILGSTTIQLVLLDITMPGEDG